MQTVTPRNYFRTLSILHLAFTAAQLLFAVIAAGLQISGAFVAPVSEELSQILMILVPVLAFAGLAASWLLFSWKIKSLKNKDSLPEKCTGYRSALIMRYALLEGPSLVAIVAFLLTGDYLFLGIAGLLIAIFVFLRPAKAAMTSQLALPYEERILLDDPDAVLYVENNSTIR